MCSGLCARVFSEPTYRLRSSFIIRPVCCCVKPQCYLMSESPVGIRVFVWLTTSLERQLWSTTSLASDCNMPPDPPNKGGQQAVQAPIFTSNHFTNRYLPLSNKFSELSGNLANNWKQWKQVWCAHELVMRLNEQTDEYRVAAFITCIGPKALAILNGLPFQSEDEKKNLAKILQLWQSSFYY